MATVGANRLVGDDGTGPVAAANAGTTPEQSTMTGSGSLRITAGQVSPPVIPNLVGLSGAAGTKVTLTIGRSITG